MLEPNSVQKASPDGGDAFKDLPSQFSNSGLGRRFREFTSADYLGKYNYKYRGCYKVYMGFDSKVVEAITALEAIKKQKASSPTKIVICVSDLPFFPPDSLEMI